MMRSTGLSLLDPLLGEPAKLLVRPLSPARHGFSPPGSGARGGCGARLQTMATPLA